MGLFNWFRSEKTTKSEIQNDTKGNFKQFWEKGKANPRCNEATLNNQELEFLCPTCENRISLDTKIIDSLLGHHIACNRCSNISHIPSIFKNNVAPKNTYITGGVLVPVKEYRDYCFNHPVHRYHVNALESKYFDDYGFYAFCANCHHRFTTPMLTTFILQSSSRPHMIFSANTEQSAKEMEGLSSGFCFSCRSDILVSIITEIPDNVRDKIIELRSEQNLD